MLSLRLARSILSIYFVDYQDEFAKVHSFCGRTVDFIGANCDDGASDSDVC